MKATLTLKDGKQHTADFDRVISAVGIVGNVENLGLEELGVKVEKTHIVIDEYCRTAAPGIYAIGDVAGPPWLAHKASHEGIICVEKIAGKQRRASAERAQHSGLHLFPSAGRLHRADRSGGESANGREIKVGRFPYRGNGKAIALGEPEGFVKTIFDAKTGELLGAHMIGAEVTELIQGFSIAKTLETTEAELMQAIFPHPTLSEMMGESVLDAYGRAIHI